MSIYVGVGILLGIILLRWGIAHWRDMRLRQWWNKGQSAIEVNDMVGAEAALRQCVRMAPIYAPVRRLLGRVLARRHKIEEAEEHLRMGAELEPRNPDGYLDLAFFLALSSAGREDEAIDAFAKAIECAPDLRASLAAENRLAHLRRDERFRKLLTLAD